jgi:hypothetical protein
MQCLRSLAAEVTLPARGELCGGGDTPIAAFARLHVEEPAVSDDRTALQTEPATDESLGELLRSRALASSPRLLIGQAVAGVALNAAVLVWHPERWGIATAAMATVALHALWSVAVQRVDARPELRGWRYVRRAAAVSASTAALLLLWFVCMMLVGRLQS